MLEKDTIYLGNNLDLIKQLDDNSIDSVVTDPPYGINFMNKKWDYDVPTTELWQEVHRVLKPGGHMLVACGTRTQHRMAVNIEDAGFEIRDIVAWVYGEGFPKNHDIEKAINKIDGVEFSSKPASGVGFMKPDNEDWHVTKNQLTQEEESSERAKQYEGFGTALKPSIELFTLARKPVSGTIAENVLKYSTGGMNIDGCRVEATDENYNEAPDYTDKTTTASVFQSGGIMRSNPNSLGRYPANLIHDGSDEVVSMFPQSSTTGNRTQKSINNCIEARKQNKGNSQCDIGGNIKKITEYGGDSGSTARFFKQCDYTEQEIKGNSIFYCPKPSKTERNMGLYNGNRNIHCTVKPVDLMRYLCRLITPKGGLVLDPYIGSGTTAIAAKQEKMHYIGMELEPEYVAISEARIKSAIVHYDIFDFIDDTEANDETRT